MSSDGEIGAPRVYIGIIICEVWSVDDIEDKD